MHCPVTWDAYEAMMQEWTKGAPPPGYWYLPPPLHQPPPPVGLSEDRQDTTKSRNDAPSSQNSSVLPVQPPSETPDEEDQDPGPCILPSGSFLLNGKMPNISCLSLAISLSTPLFVNTNKPLTAYLYDWLEVNATNKILYNYFCYLIHELTRSISVECKPPACREYGVHKIWRDVAILLWPWCDLHLDVWPWLY